MMVRLTKSSSTGKTRFKGRKQKERATSESVPQDVIASPCTYASPEAPTPKRPFSQ